MRLNRGKIVALVWFGAVAMLFGDNDIAYRLQTDTNATYRYAPVHIDVEINQTDPTHIILFDFAPQPSPKYHTVQIDAMHDDTPHHTRHRYRFELYPLHVGDINVTFNLTKRITDDRKMAFSASGDRDDYKKLETFDVPVSLPPLRLKVRPLPPQTQLVGRYRLEVNATKRQGEAFEPMLVTVWLYGEGYPPKLSRIFSLPKGVTRFAKKPQLKRIITPRGIRYDVRYTLAFASKHAFTLPPVALRAFDPQKQQSYTLTAPAQHFKITPVSPKDRIDTTDAPPPLASPTAILTKWLGYAFAFLAGFLSAWIVLRLKRSTHKPNRRDPLRTAIDETTDTKALYRLLLSRDARRFAPVLYAVEQGETNLKKLKAQAKECL